jgi:hypothetical protein
MVKTHFKFILFISLCIGTLSLSAQSFKNVTELEAEADYFIDFGNDVVFGVDEKNTLRKRKYAIYRMNNGKVEAEYSFENEHDRKLARDYSIKKNGEKLYIFESEGTKKEIVIFVSEIDVETLQPKGDRRKIVSLKNDKSYATAYFYVSSSENDEFHYLQVDDKNFLLDKDFKLLVKPVLPGNLKNYVNRFSKVLNDGTVYSVFIKIYEGNLSSTAMFTIESAYVTKMKSEGQVISKEIGKGLYLDLEGFSVNSDGSLVLAAFTGVMERGSLLQSSNLNKQFMRDGYYFVHLSKDLEVLSENQHTFDADFFSNGEKQLAQNKIERQSAKGKSLASPILNHRALIKAEDGYYLIGEEAQVSSSVNAEGKRENKKFNGTIYAIRISENGEFKECVKVFRKRYVTSMFGFSNTADFNAFVHNNKLYILFEDIRANDDVITEDRVQKIVVYETNAVLRTYVVKISGDDITKELLSQKYDDAVVNKVSKEDDGRVFLNLQDGKTSYKVELGFDE